MLTDVLLTEEYHPVVFPRSSLQGKSEILDEENNLEFRKKYLGKSKEIQ